MQPRQTGVFELLGDFQWPGVVFFFLTVIALRQPDSFTVNEIKSGNDMPGFLKTEKQRL